MAGDAGMANREDWGLRLLVGGMGLGMGLMLFVVSLQGTAFYQTWFAASPTGVMHPLGFLVDGLTVLSFASAVAGIGCFTGTRPEPTAARAAVPRGRPEPRAARHRRPGAPHGST